MERKSEDSLNKNLFVVGVVEVNDFAVKQEMYQWKDGTRKNGYLKMPFVLENGVQALLQIKLENSPCTSLAFRAIPLNNSITMIPVDLSMECCIEALLSAISSRAQYIEYLCIVCITKEDAFSNMYKLQKLAKFLSLDVITFDELSTSARFYELCKKYANAFSRNQYIPTGFYLGHLNAIYVQECFERAKKTEKEAFFKAYSDSSILPSMDDNSCCFQLREYLENEKTGNVNTTPFKRLFVGELLKKTTKNEHYQSLLLYGFMILLKQSEEVACQLSTQSLRNIGLRYFHLFSKKEEGVPSEITGIIIDFFCALYKEEDAPKHQLFF